MSLAPLSILSLLVTDDLEVGEITNVVLTLFDLYPSAVAVAVTSNVLDDFTISDEITLVNSPLELAIPEKGSPFIFPDKKAPSIGLSEIASFTVNKIDGLLLFPVFSIAISID